MRRDYSRPQIRPSRAKPGSDILYDRNIIKYFVNETLALPKWDAQEQRDLGKLLIEAVDGNARLYARNELILANIGLAIGRAKVFARANRSIELADYVMAACLGLIHAANKYDYSLGNKFDTYAYSYIRGELLDLAQKASRMIYLPEDPTSKLAKIEYNINHPDIDKQDREAVDELRMLLSASKAHVSLNQPLPSDESALIDLQGRIDDSYLEREKQTAIAQALRSLTPLQQEVLIFGHGLFGNVKKSLAQIGRERKVTRKAIWIVEHRALARLRNTAREKLKVYYND